MKNETCYCNKITILHSFSILDLFIYKYIYIYIRVCHLSPWLIFEEPDKPDKNNNYYFIFVNYIMIIKLFVFLPVFLKHQSIAPNITSFTMSVSAQCHCII